jgi:DNA-binding transcriptional MerR regulator
MRIAELSSRSGVPIPTIKYYLREGLLPPGERTLPNQAQYEDAHLRRLKLVRALVDVGGLSIAAAREVLSRMDSPGTTALDTLGKAQYSITARRDHVEDEAWERAGKEVDDLIAKRGWRVKASNPTRQTLAEVLATLYRLGHDDYVSGLLDRYAETTEELAATEIEVLGRRHDVDSMAEAVVVWTVLGDALLAALRRLAQEAESTRRFGGHAYGPPGAPGAPEAPRPPEG